MFDKLLYPIDRMVNKLSMYRLLLYYLIGLIVVAIIFSSVGIMHFSALSIAISAIVLVLSCWIINKLFAYIFDAPINPESSILTGLILALIIPSSPSGFGLLFMLAAAGLAMGSKYLLSIKSKHIFNPAAIAVFLTAIGPHQSASWWIGTASMLPFVIIGGILITRKIRREPMVITYLLATTIATALFSIIGGNGVATNLKNMALNSAVFFLGFVMLTEPYTSPDTKGKRMLYGAIIGVILAPQFHIGHYYSTPEFALVIGNLFAYIVSNKDKLFPTLRKKYLIAKDSAEFVFAPQHKFAYEPGQYMEFTLPHDKPDTRGSRRWFTLSSSPTEPDVKIGVRFYKDGSSYKSALADIEPGDQIVAAQLAGDFTLPKDPSQKLLFIAGGIGITPFRSMVKYLIDKRQQRDIVLFYSARSPEYVAYTELFDEAAKKINLKVGYVIDGNQAGRLENGINGRLNAKLISSKVPDFKDRLIYISGPLKMTEEIKEDLIAVGVNRANIKIDFFSGYA